MLDLRRDLYARIALSAQKDRRLNARFRTGADQYESALHPKASKDLIELQAAAPHAIDAGAAIIHKSKMKVPDEVVVLSPGKREMIGHMPISYPIERIPVHTVEKKTRIDEQIERIMHDPKILEIQRDIEDAELTLMRLRSHPDKARIESLKHTIDNLKRILEQKTYI